MIANKGSRPTKYRQISEPKKKKEGPTLEMKLCVTSDMSKKICSGKILFKKKRIFTTLGHLEDLSLLSLFYLFFPRAEK